MTLVHGGSLVQIKQDYPDFKGEWLDLSTGVSPYHYEADDVNLECLSKLPDQTELLTDVARQYYGVDELLMTPGSMWSIKQLPFILDEYLPKNGIILLPSKGFAEHRLAWEFAGYEIDVYDGMPQDEQITKASVCVSINPNNPTGLLLNQNTLEAMLLKTAVSNCFLIMDEAFMDTRPVASVINSIQESWPDHLILLRSFGKFFGLPGLRLGSLIANQKILNKANAMMGPWAVNSLAQNIAIKAFEDKAWQREARDRIKTMSTALKDALLSMGMQVESSDLFATCSLIGAKRYWMHLLRQGIYTRLLDDESGIRIGLPKSQEELQRLQNCINNLNKTILKVAS